MWNDEELPEAVRRVGELDDCAHCGRAADQHRPVGPITVRISEPDEGETFAVQFCEWRCFAQWAAVQAGGTFVFERS